MSKLNKQFIPHNESLSLKELGFVEECFAFYDEFGLLNIGKSGFSKKEDQLYFSKAPLWQQAFDWFRTEHNLHIEIRSFTVNKFTFVIQKIENIIKYIVYGSYKHSYSTYEETSLECLRKLIEIAKSRNIQ